MNPNYKLRPLSDLTQDNLKDYGTSLFTRHIYGLVIPIEGEEWVSYSCNQDSKYRPTAFHMSRKSHIENLEPMAVNGDRVHSGMVFTAKALSGLVITMLFGLAVWAIKASDYKG